MNTVVMQSTSLYFKDSTSDKVYNVTLEEADGGYIVNCAWGRRGSALQSATQTKSPVPIDQAIKIYQKKISEKTSKGYQVTKGNGDTITVPDTEQPHKPICVLLNPIDDDKLQQLLKDDAWIMQEKKDGVRLTIIKEKNKLTGISRTGRQATIPGELSKVLKSHQTDFIIDGELIGDTFHAFDLLEEDGHDFRGNTTTERHEQLDMLIRTLPDSTSLELVTTFAGAEKKLVFEKLKGTEGVVFKRAAAQYHVGRPSSGGDFLKYKFYKSCSAIVTGINDKRSVSLSLIEDKPEPGSEVVIGKRMKDVGNCTIPVNHDFPNFGDVVEIKYLYARKPSHALYQPSYLGKRTDIPVTDCLLSQLSYKVGEEDE